ncbi:MAG: hypothetical protein ACK2U9_21885, partial [Anaerolineae bacterium]
LRTNHPDGGAYYLRGEQCGWDTTTCPLYDDATHGDGWADDRIHSLSHTVNSPLSSYDGFKFWRADGNKWLPSGSDLTFDSVGACTIYMLAQANPYGITVNDCQSYAYVTCDAATHDFSPVSFLGNEDFGAATEAYVTEGDTVDLRVEVYAAGLTDAGAATAGSAVQVGLETRTWQAASQTWGTWTDYGTPFSFELDEGNNWQYLLPGVSLPQGIHELRAKYTDWTGATGNTGSNTRVLFVSDAANTPHSIQVDAALADWRANESHAGRDGTTNDVTWDDRYVYVAWDGGGSSDKCIVGFDLDLGTANDTVAYGGAAFPATGQPDFVLEYYKGTDATYFFQRSGATWVDVGTSGIAVAEGSSPVACEARIPRTRFGGDLDLDDDLGIVIYQSNSTSSWVFGASPVAGNSSGSATQSLNAQFHWPSTGSDVAPNAPAVGGRSEYAVHAVAGGAAGSYVFGETGATIDFPLADDAPDAGCDIDARVYENHLLPNGSAAVKRHYELQAGGCAGYSADLTLSYADGELTGNTETSLDLYRWTGSAWELHSVSSEDRDTTNNQLAARDVTAFSSWGADDASPTAIDLASFAAQPLAGAVSLKWQTASEVNLIGFHLYRAVAGSPEVRLNADLIPARQPGSPIGASYAWLDDDVAPGVTCNYWLEWLDSLGAPQRYGPVSVVPFTLYHIYLPLVTH